MSFLKKHKLKLTAAVIAVILLAVAFVFGGTSVPKNNDLSPSPTALAVKDREQVPDGAYGENTSEDETNDAAENEENETSEKADEYYETGDIEYSEANGMVINEETGTDAYMTEPVPEGKPVPSDTQDEQVTDTELTCTLSVRCDTALQNIKYLDSEKAKLLPQDGVIFPEQTVTFYEGESVFNLLLREMKKNKIHMEFKNTPMYNSAYIEGINNLYEYDCGELSGWMYKVNDWFPNYGCSRYQLKKGDKVEFVYTCNLGEDVKASSGAMGEQR